MKDHPMTHTQMRYVGNYDGFIFCPYCGKKLPPQLPDKSD